MNKTEITAKIKKAIEDKLCSLGAYVDKELPEYILVMIANKKSKESMAKDLQLFLGTETTSFIEWLHELLEKCQTNPEDAFHLKIEKPSKSKSSDLQEKKRKLDKDKQKAKSKSKKSDEKKERKKSLNKLNKARSRSRSSKLEITRNTESKKVKSKLTPEKFEAKAVNKQSDIERNIEDTIIDKHESVEPKVLTSVLSTVKVTERPIPKKDIFKTSIEMIQRDLKEAEADISNKIEPIIEKYTQRMSVFDRLGTNDLRKTKLMKKDEAPQKAKSPLKRTVQSIISDKETNLDIRESKVKRLENHSPSPNFIVTLKGAENLSAPLISRLGPKRSQEAMDSIEDDVYNVETIGTDADNVQETKDSSESIIDAQTKCKFWPSCKNKDICPYVHPSEPCKAFPNCKFGVLCLYIHPNCKFSSNCSKPDCPFTHYGPRLLSTVKSGQNSIRCAYYPNCTNVNCQYFHPNYPCKFGLSCKLKSTCLFYHPSIPKMNELKWIASQETPNSTIIAAGSKKSEIQTV